MQTMSRYTVNLTGPDEGTVAYRVGVATVEPGVQALDLDGVTIAYATRAGGAGVRIERTVGDRSTRTLPSVPLALRWAVIGAVA